MRIQALALLDPGDARDEGRWGVLKVDVELRSPKFTAAALLSELMKANLVSGDFVGEMCLQINAESFFFSPLCVCSRCWPDSVQGALWFVTQRSCCRHQCFPAEAIAGRFTTADSSKRQPAVFGIYMLSNINDDKNAPPFVAAFDLRTNFFESVFSLKMTFCSLLQSANPGETTG